MRLRIKPWQLALVLVLICFGAVGALRWYRNARPYDAAGLFALLPTDRATLFYADTGLMRQSKILDLIAGSKATEEPDYQKFVEQTGFDYRTDLDAVAAAFRGRDSYFALRGRFQWTQLENYAKLQGGACQYTICSMPGSSPERNISFYPVSRQVLALAVSKEPRGVSAISDRGRSVRMDVPQEPVWLSAPSQALKESTTLPDSLKTLLSPVAQADNLTIALGAQGDQFQLRVEVACRNKEVAAGLSRDLSSALQLLQQIVRQTDNSNDAGGFGPTLLSGAFQLHDTRVTGTWPIQRRLMQNLLAAQPE